MVSYTCNYISSLTWFLLISAKYRYLLYLVNIRLDFQDICIENLCIEGVYVLDSYSKDIPEESGTRLQQDSFCISYLFKPVNLPISIARS